MRASTPGRPEDPAAPFVLDRRLWGDLREQGLEPRLALPQCTIAAAASRLTGAPT